MKSKFTLVILPLILINWSLFGQVHHEWSFGIGSKNSDHVGTSFADHAGNIYSILEMTDSVDIDPGPGEEIIVPEENSISYILTKNDEDGNLVYGYSFYVFDEDSYGYLSEVSQNQIRVSFGFTDSLVYERNGIREKLFSQPGKYNAILTLDLDGKLIDSFFFHSPEEFYFISFHTLPDGKVLLAGTFSDTFALNPQSPFTLYSTGNTDCFIMMTDQNFNTLWIRQFKGNDDDFMSSMYVLNQDRIYFAMGYYDTLSVATLQGPITTISAGEADGLFGYMNMSGDVEKVFFINGPGYDELEDLQADAAGNIYICGFFENTVNFANPSQPPVLHSATAESDGFIAKYTPNGNLVWIDLYLNTHYGGIHTLSLKRGNELYLSGTFSLRADLNPGPDSLIVETGLNSSPFISKLSTDGEFIWSIPFLTINLAGIRAVMVNTETSRIVANGFFYDSIHCSEIPGQNWLGTPYGADCFLISLSEENVVTATREQTPIEIGVYPNPTSGSLHINAEKEINQVNIQSMDGKLIGNWNFIPSEQQEMDLQDLPSGLYFLSIQSGDQWSTEKIVIQ